MTTPEYPPQGGDMWFSRRQILVGAASALLAVGTAYVIDRNNILVKAEQAIFDDAPLPLQPESDQLTIKWLPDTVTKWQDIIIEMGQKYDVSPDLLAILMTLESGGYSKAGSEAGAQGLMQITPPTAKDIASKYLKESRDEYDIFDPRTNIEFGAAYVAHLRDEFGQTEGDEDHADSVELIAAGYNGGPGAANSLYKGEGLGSIETLSYSRDARNMWRERHAATSPTYQRWYDRGGVDLINMAAAEE